MKKMIFSLIFTISAIFASAQGATCVQFNLQDCSNASASNGTIPGHIKFLRSGEIMDSIVLYSKMTLTQVEDRIKKVHLPAAQSALFRQLNHINSIHKFYVDNAGNLDPITSITEAVDTVLVGIIQMGGTLTAEKMQAGKYTLMGILSDNSGTTAEVTRSLYRADEEFLILTMPNKSRTRYALVSMMCFNPVPLRFMETYAKLAQGAGQPTGNGLETPDPAATASSNVPAKAAAPTGSGTGTITITTDGQATQAGAGTTVIHLSMNNSANNSTNVHNPNTNTHYGTKVTTGGAGGGTTGTAPTATWNPYGNETVTIADAPVNLIRQAPSQQYAYQQRYVQSAPAVQTQMVQQQPVQQVVVKEKNGAKNFMYVMLGLGAAAYGTGELLEGVGILKGRTQDQVNIFNQGGGVQTPPTLPGGGPSDFPNGNQSGQCPMGTVWDGYNCI